MLYTAIKHPHVLFALLSVLLFNFRFWRYFKGERPKWARILPHILDTLFLISGIALAVLGRINPISTGGSWLGVKLLLLLFYIFFGILAMRQSRVDSVRYINYILANIMVVGMLYFALIKPIIF